MLTLSKTCIDEFHDSEGYFMKQNKRYNINDYDVLEQTFKIDDIDDGMYTFAITSTDKLIMSMVKDKYENGSKHLQICNSTHERDFKTGGELYKHDKRVFFNLYSGLFEAINDVNIVSHTEQLFHSILISLDEHIEDKNTEIFYFKKD